MFKDVNEYLGELKRELEGCDPALIQDALSDAEGYLRMALEEALSSMSSSSETEAIAAIIEKYGNPKEIASAYRAIESRTSSYWPCLFFRHSHNGCSSIKVFPLSLVVLGSWPSFDQFETACLSSGVVNSLDHCGWDYSVPSNPASGQVRREDSREFRQVHAGEKTKGTFPMTFSSTI